MSIVAAITSAVMITTSWEAGKKMENLTIEWNLMKYNSTSLELIMISDAKSMSFSACVMLITTAVLIYSSFYMEGSKKVTSFLKLIMTFVTSMIILIHSANLVSLMLGWEGLGMASFVLIMYYQNSKSLSSSMYTMLMNRVGDISLMIGMMLMMNVNSWAFTAMEFESPSTAMMLVMTAAFSKSAQIPFSSWLTEAMAAPTPISALVHSSTLVTAGVFMMIRFEPVMKYTSMNEIMMTTSVMTLVMASLNSLKEWDIKKTVALSTLTQLSMMFITISINMYGLAMFHMMVHATFKALIFLCSSSMISTSNTQDMRKMKGNGTNMMFTKTSFNAANLTLCGFPFMSSSYSKEMIMEMMTVQKMNSAFVVMFYSSMAATLVYALKMMMITNNMNKSKTLTEKSENSHQKLSSMVLVAPSIMYGNKMNWMININFNIPMTTPTAKILPITMMVIAVMLSTKLMNTKTTMSSNKKSMFMNYMWFMKNFTIQLKKTQMGMVFEAFKQTEKASFNSMVKSVKQSVSVMSHKNYSVTHKKYSKMSMMIMTSMTIMF